MARVIYVVTAIIWTSHIVAGMGMFNLGNGYRMLRRTLEASEVSKDLSLIQTRWIEQPVDQFNKSDVRMWDMRYLERVDMWKPGGPIYVFIGGHEAVNKYFLTGGMVYELANETNGALFMSEHRFYGKSMPFYSTGTDKLKYLSSRQALADLSRLIKQIKGNSIYKSSKVVLIGGAYAGNLATWMKLLYPDQIDAAWASSAPVLAKQDFYEYLETVTDVFEKFGGKECTDRIKATFQRYSDLMKSKKGIETLKAENKICKTSNLSRPENQILFTYDRAWHFMYTAQLGTVDKIKDKCNHLISDSRTSIVENAQSAMDRSYYSFWNRKDQCLEIDYDKIVKAIREGGGVSIWQMCTEFSCAPTTTSDRQIFSKNIPLSSFYKLCVDSFGEDYGEKNVARSVKHTNEMYGGLKPNVEKVVFVNGEMDPWHRLGILKDLSSDAPAKLVPRSSQCNDLLSNSQGDPEEIVETRKYVKSIIKHWIGIGSD